VAALQLLQAVAAADTRNHPVADTELPEVAADSHHIHTEPAAQTAVAAAVHRVVAAAASPRHRSRSACHLLLQEDVHMHAAAPKDLHMQSWVSKAAASLLSHTCCQTRAALALKVIPTITESICP
jgi:hypothetical protein